MALFKNILGEGTDIVLLHGWGMHSGIWQSLPQQLAQQMTQQHRITTIDLPGHGNSSATIKTDTLEKLAETIAPHLPTQAIIIGWSLGGMAAMQLALMLPEKISRLILITSSARFTQTNNLNINQTGHWPHAMAPEVLQQFSQMLQQDPQATLRRFLSLQLRGCDNERELLRQLLQLLNQSDMPNNDALRDTLNILAKSDLRHQIKNINCPVRLIYGQHDRIVPSSVGDTMTNCLPNAKQHTIAGAGHAPFLSHPEKFLELLNKYLYD